MLYFLQCQYSSFALFLIVIFFSFCSIFCKLLQSDDLWQFYCHSETAVIVRIKLQNLKIELFFQLIKLACKGLST